MTISPPPAFFTIGHSNRSLDAFVELLRGPRIEWVADVRKLPMSRANPQFNREALSAALAAFQIGYEHIPALGGLRGKARALPSDINGFWTNRSFHNYADYALGEAFAEGLAVLLAESAERPTAIMCAEAVWWRCHRRIVADYAMHRGRAVVHLMAPGRNSDARMTPSAVAVGSALHYPAVEGSGE